MSTRDPQKGQLQREHFSTSRLLDFLSEKELTAQIGHARSAWPLVLVKELLDNALDACEESGTPPTVQIKVDGDGLTVTDNGPGIPGEVIESILDYSVRVSSREAYVSPDRGAQGNALKTVLAMPFVLDGKEGRVTIRSQGVRHEIVIGVDQVRQCPAIDPTTHKDPQFVKSGTSVRVHLASTFFAEVAETDESPIDDPLALAFEMLLPELEKADETDEELASTLLNAKGRFLQFASDFTWLNPHLSLTVEWFGERLLDVKATDPSWKKWGPSDPTSPHWYQREHLDRLVAAHLVHDPTRTVRDLISEFRGLAGSASQKKVLDATSLHRQPLTALLNGDGKSLDAGRIKSLLDAMRAESKPVKPAKLGVIGKEHFAAQFKANGCEMKSFQYKRILGESDSVPWIVETAFGWCPEAEQRRTVTGVNWSPGIINPFRELGKWGQSLDSLLERQYSGEYEPVILVLHLSCPRVQFADRGKSIVVIGE